MFLKRLSRGSRANSYAEEDFAERPRSQDVKYAQQDSPRQSALQHNTYPDETSHSPANEQAHNMYRSQLPSEPYSQRAVPGAGPLNGSLAANSRQNSAAFEVTGTPSRSSEMAPDFLTRAFNEALRPHQEKLEGLEGQLADLQLYVEQLENQRSEFFSWIDKRGLRPGKHFIDNKVS
jgi:hypothetical protein